MMYDSFFHALQNEVRMLPATHRGLRRLGYKLPAIGKFLTGRYLSKETETPSQGFRTQEGFDLVRRRDFVLYQEIFIMDTYQVPIWAKDFSACQTPVVLDIGANVGMFSALCASLNPSVKLSCFDIVPECSGAVTNRLSPLGVVPRHVVAAAVGSRHGGELTIHYDHPYDAANSVEKNSGRREAIVPRVSIDGWCEEVGLRDPVFLAKVDVEGAECDVLRGGMATFGRTEIILMELHGTLDALPLLLPTHEELAREKLGGEAWVSILRLRRSV